jgi:hypothetical protein
VVSGSIQRFGAALNLKVQGIIDRLVQLLARKGLPNAKPGAT